MKKICIGFLFLGLFLAPCMGQESDDPIGEIIVYRLPDPERVYIYQNGGVIYNAVIPGNGIVNNTFILPENVQLDSLTISQSGKRIYSYSTEIGEVLVMMRRGERPDLVRVLQVHVSESLSGMPLAVEYGISWAFNLDMEMREQNYLDCAPLAVITTNSQLPETTKSILAKQPEIILASAQNMLLENAGAVFNLGKPVITENRRMLVKLEEGRTPYTLVYQWDANRRERPWAYLRAKKNPHPHIGPPCGSRTVSYQPF
jgi:hypothetical protein